MTTEWSLENWRHGQVSAERMCLQLLSIEGFKELDPQCPLGGRDGRKDILCTKDGSKYVAAAYFPTKKVTKFKDLEDKFLHDLEGVKTNMVDGIVFLTGQKITPAQRKDLSEAAAKAGAKDILYHQERMVGLLDGPLGFAARLEFLKIPMRPEEQMAFVLALRGGHAREIQDALGRVEKKVDELASRSKEQSQASPPASTEEPGKDATGQKGKISTSVAKQQVVGVWTDVLEAIKQGALSEFSKSKCLDKLKIARLGLVVAGITNRDIEAEMPGVHLTNLLFKNRGQIELTQLEWFLVLRANLVPQSGYQPCWFWIRKTKLNVKEALVYLSCHDDHASVRKAAIGYAKGLGIALDTGRGKKQRPIEVLCFHSDENTRKSALEYLAEKGSAKDLPLVEKLRTDSDVDVRSQAELTRDAILLREDVSLFFENSVLTGLRLSDDRLGAIQEHVIGIKTELLKQALSHSDSKVQVFAAKELVARSSITLEDITLLKDYDAACEVRQEYYVKAIDAGQKFQPNEIREGLKPSFLTLDLYCHTRVDADLVVTELFKLYEYDELMAVANSESDDTRIAYRVLAEKHFDKFGDKVRADLKDDFATLRAKLKAREEPALRPPSLTFLAAIIGEWKPDISDFAAAGLSALAMNGNGSDRELIIPFLDHESDRVRIAAITALRRVGTPQDTELALQIAEEASDEVAAEAAKTALALAPGEAGSAIRLLKSGKSALVRLAILSLLDCNPRKVWPQIENRLYDEDEEIRKLICAYAIKKLPAKRLAKLLDAYLAKERYYYNVVYFLDRALYAKDPLRKLFIKEIEAVLD